MMNSNFNGLRILVTGHTGFKGSWLCKWLHMLGAKVSGISLDPPTVPSLFVNANIKENVNDYRIDIRNQDKLYAAIKKINPELVFHLAAQPLVLHSYEHPVVSFETNISGTTYLLESLRSLNALRGVVCITTDKVYENKESTLGYEESDQLGGYDPYSSSKAASEIVIASYARSFFNAKKIPVISARAGNVIGGGDWADNRLIPDYFRALKSSNDLIIRSPSSVRPWQHVMEPLSGYLKIANAILTGKIVEHEAYNFGPRADAQIPVSGVIDLLNKAVASSSVKKEVNVQYIKSNNHETKHLWLNCRKAQDKLGWTSLLDIDSTIRLTAEFYLSNLNGIENVEDIMSSQIQTYMEKEKSFDY